MDGVDVSIIVPVFNKLAFTRQCLERLGRDLAGPTFEVLIVDNGSSDDTERFFRTGPDFGYPLTYLRNAENLGFSRANNVGSASARGRYLLFLNNDTLATPGWLAAMMGVAERDAKVGIVGIKQLFPYTNRIHHTGIIFTADKRPQHIYPHAVASLPHVNREREYQAVTGSCLLISRELFDACGQFDVGYRNGYEDIDLCLQARARGRSVVCCTSGFIYHYGQISETRTADDDANAARLAERWAATITPDELKYFREDRRDIEATAPAAADTPRLDRDAIYFADDLSTSSALSWVTDELIRALERQGRDVSIRSTPVIAQASGTRRAFLERRMRRGPVFGGVQVRWSHFWPQHLNLDLNGRLNLELFVINYQFGAPGSQPWDYWLQCLPQNHYLKLPLSQFCQDVLTQVGVPASEGTVVRPGYAPEIPHVAAPRRHGQAFRLLSVTNSHDLERYGTRLLLEAYWSTFSKRDDVVLVLKDYGVSSGDTTLRDLLRERSDQAAVEYITAFTSKEKLIELYRSCDAFVSAHRGEGYGMKILDALACGLPVVTPLFGGPVDFCTTENSLPVDFTLTPVGDCLDTRALRITNRPLWAEPSVSSLGAQMRALADSPSLAARLGGRGAADVLDRFTWDAAANALTTLIDANGGAASTSAPATVSAPVPVNTESSPYWLGCRISVIVPTYNRCATLRQCLDALERQTILPQEFEVIVVDDGSTDETRAMVESARTTFRLAYVHQTNAGPGAARNLGLRHATGEFVMYIGDDIIADERLLESHLVAHATRPAPGTAVLGHIDWAPHLERTPVMDFICGPSTLQFAYAFIPTLPSLDFRFFYTSNLSLKRTFLVEAADEGVAFDPCFAKAAFEDSEFALRLAPRGLEIVYCADAKAYHDHWMDVDTFSRRERSAGQMAVIFYRKHPQIDEQLQVRWIGDWTDAVEELLGRPELDAKLSALNDQTEAFLQSLATMLDDLGRLQRDLGTSVLKRPGSGAGHTLLEAVYSVIFDVARTRGKVEEWYRGVDDPRRVDAAVRLICCARRLEFLSASPLELQRLRGTIHWLETDVFQSLETRIVDLERHIAIPSPAGGRPTAMAPASAGSVGDLHARLSTLNTKLGPPAGPRRRLDRMVLRTLRRADLKIQYELGRRPNGPWLARYHAIRRRLRRWLPAPSRPRR